jgi:anthranilate phosphoribosyltransferase
MAISDAIRTATEGKDLTAGEAHAAMTEIMSGTASAAQIAAFLIAIRMKGETVEEITEFARVMREHVVVVAPSRRPLVDTCGTGGDAVKTFNISTTAAFVAAGAGVAVAKHGNRSVSSKCGSSDVLEALGVRVEQSPEEVARSIEEVGIGFMFAPAFHPAMRHAGPVRRELAMRTVFNALGPLTNPAGAEAQVIGVYAPELTELHAGALRNLGCRRAFVVHGQEGMDEFSTLGPTRVTEVRDGWQRTYDLTPGEVGLPRAHLEDIAGSGPAENASLLLAILEGAEGPARDIVLFNAAAAIAAGGLAAPLPEGLLLARESIDSGRARQKLAQLQTAAAGR